MFESLFLITFEGYFKFGFGRKYLITLMTYIFAIKVLIVENISLSTRSRVITSYQGESIIFHNDKFLQLQGVLLTHPHFCWTKERAHTTYSIVICLSLGECYCSPSGLQSCIHPRKDRKERATPYNKRERESFSG